MFLGVLEPRYSIWSAEGLSGVGPSIEMIPETYWRFLGRWWWLIGLFGVAGVGMAFFWISVAPVEYRSLAILEHNYVQGLDGSILVDASALAIESTRLAVQLETVESMAELEEAAGRGDWDLFVRTFVIQGPKIPPHVVDAIQASPFWAPMIADAPASLSDFRALSSYEFEPARFAALTMPVLLLVGSDSPRDNYVTDAIAGVLPDHQIVELQGQGHIATAMAPDLFVDTVSQFLLG